MSTSYFVAADWLIEHGDDPEVQIIDARMAPAGQEHLRDMVAEYRAGHLTQRTNRSNAAREGFTPDSAGESVPAKRLANSARRTQQQVALHLLAH